jgi:hypothetical protein
MEQNKNKFIEKISSRKEALPDDFWATIEPEIPIYKKKNRRPIFFTKSCLGITMLFVSTILYFAYYHFEKSSTTKLIKNDINIYQKLPLKLDTTSENINIANTTTQSNNNDQPTKSNELPNQKQEKNEVKKQSIQNNNSKNTKVYSTLNSLPKKRPEVPNKEQSKSTLETPKQSTQLLSNIDLISNATKSIIVDDESETQPGTSNSNKESITSTKIPDKKAEMQQLNSIIAKPIYSKEIAIDLLLIPFDSKIKPSITKNNAIELAYYIGKPSSSMVAKNEENDNKLLNREKSESNFYSHGITASWQQKINKNLSTNVGLSYTNIQKLFDHKLKVENEESLVYKTGTRTISTTQSLKLIDFQIGLQYKIPLSKRLSLLPIAVIGYNISLTPSGNFLDDNAAISLLEKSNIYKKTIGLNYEAGLKLSYSINKNYYSYFSTNFRQYLNNFHAETYGIETKYKGLIMGIGIGYKI